MRDWRNEPGMEPHPEGGFFRRLYTSPGHVALPRGERPLATSIHYLLTREQPRGKLHRNRSDILHFLVDGGPVRYVTAGERGTVEYVTLRPGGEHFLVVPGGRWKASHLVEDAPYALVAEVVTPGFDYADHEFATAEDVAHLGQAAAELAPFLP
ncbi:cupin domain-containing protein [Streptomyces sp. NPDC093595]|uniref:cupin domain-containing protein n=1 Tax=Streptomyces sp. NPDC093595 TaxID=3366045 RepID=UPI00381D032B